MSVTLPFSQSTYGGHLACTSIAVGVACATANGHTTSETSLQQLTKEGCTRWVHSSQGVQHAEEVVATSDVAAGLCVESNVCSAHAAHDGRGRLKSVFEEMAAADSSAAVVTDGASSYSVGYQCKSEPRFFIFNSHSPNAVLHLVDTAEAVERSLVGMLAQTTSVDVTTFLPKIVIRADCL